jgi:hypothetical protein
MVSCRQPLVVRKKMQKSLVGGPQSGIRTANDVADARGHDANNEIVLDVEDLSRSKVRS